LVLFGCDPDRKKKVDPEKGRYGTLDSSELFFKNMRQYYYDLTPMREAGLEIYRLQDRVADTIKPILNLNIIFNWRTDEAFIYLEPNRYFIDSTQFTIHWQDTITNEIGEYTFIKGNRDSHYTFAAKIYNSILDEHKLFYKKEDELISMLDNDLERDVFRVTMFDFLRLVNYFSRKAS